MSATGPMRLTVACDLYGLSAETSVLTPMETAATDGNRVELLYQRASRYLREEGRSPEADKAETRGLRLVEVPKLHGKVLLVGADMAVVTSFNWMSTALDGTRSRNAEFGVRIVGSGIADHLRRQLGQLAPAFLADFEPTSVQADLLKPTAQP
jgi:phosphatidylserine/phosphatidylglycerophosphate/cardiolipin synthase-like enzyme